MKKKSGLKNMERIVCVYVCVFVRVFVWGRRELESMFAMIRKPQHTHKQTNTDGITSVRSADYHNR